ncbi:iron complex outermembrane recepter protein [Cyclobacterium lianum]|uniref:Iron complex outermembrane recepter protein n=1 Tax=Cyclobacterium lianum TaxID=388280 RepID=A0A1M7LFP7_9BACT|nr:TonB-dependent receptor [Cyclobacterium lianum]SHM76899.1 iron complex outermembrane recepter protein [Cyclobacterium lianum]
MENNLLRLIVLYSKQILKHIFLQMLFIQVIVANPGSSKCMEDDQAIVEMKEPEWVRGLAEPERQTDITLAYNQEITSDYLPVMLAVKPELNTDLKRNSRLEDSGFKQENDQRFEVKSGVGMISAETLPAGLDTPESLNVEISGTVRDENGDPIPGATITILGTSVGTVTDLDGNYTLEVPEGATIVFSYIGYESRRIEIGDESVMNVILSPDLTALEEVVVVGYGTQEKKDITGSVASVKSEDFNRGIINSPGQLLQGKVSGVNVTSSSGAPGSGQRIIIRGQGSIRQGTGPLFVVDGFPLGLAGTGGADSPLNFLNPEDIESIDVLKDASATAIYGARGANGVVIITTKKGSAGVSKVSVNTNFGISNMAREIPVFSADEFRQQVVAVGGILEDRGGDTNWQDELTRTAITNDHNMVFQGGSQNFNYRASLGYLDQQGIVLNTGFKRYSGRIGATQKLWDGQLSIDFNLGSSIEKGENAPQSRLVSEMLEFNPTYPARDADGMPVRYPDLINPLYSAELYTRFSETRRTLLSISPSFEIIDGLVYKANFGYDTRSSAVDNQSMPNKDPFEEGRLEQSFSDGENTLIENYLTYNFGIGTDHGFTVLGGHSYQRIYNRGRSWSVDLFTDNGIEPRYNPGLGQRLNLVDNPPGGSANINELQSFFGRVNYDFREKYLLTATLRADGSSKFGANNKYGTFPSFAAGWRLSEEVIMQSSPFSDLKLRAGWGQTGNQEIPNKITQASYTTRISNQDSYPLGGQEPPYTAGTAFVRLANPNLQWEVSTQTNVGIDFELFEGALSGTIDYFNKVSNNILLEVKPPDPIQPATDYWTNVEDMKITNKGLELALNYQHNTEGGLYYSIGGNATFINNEVQNSPFTIVTTGSAEGSGLTGATINGLINGHPIGTFYMQRFIGIGPDGLSVFEDSEDGGRMVVGSALPDMTYNFFLNLNYRNFDIGTNFNGVSGNMIYNNTAMNKFYKAKLANALNTTDKALEYPEESIINSSSVSTRYLENGSFFRLNNATLGYNFNTTNLGIASWAKELRLSLTGQNLFLITDYTGYDPEVNQDRSVDGIQSAGIDLNGYPRARTFVMSLNASF